MKLPSKRNVEAAKNLFARFPILKLASDTVSWHFKNHLENTNLHEIVVKVVLLNGTYGTKLPQPVLFARYIYDLRRHNLDARLAAGDVKAVEQLASAPPPLRKERVFASKYAHFHNKAAFPIYDSRVVDALKHFLRIDFSPSLAYADFFQTMEKFRVDCGLSSVNWEDLDKFLWLYGQMLRLRSGKKEVNKEIHSLWGSPEGKPLFKSLDP